MKCITRTFILSSLVVFLSGCGAPETASTNSRNPDGSVTIPFNRTLIDREKRTLDARVIGFNGRVVTVIRLKDQSQFDIPLTKLSKRDQDFFQGVGIKSPPNPTPGTLSSNLEAVKKSADTKRLNEIKREIEELLKEMSKYDIDTMKWRSLNREIAELRKEQDSLR